MAVWNKDYNLIYSLCPRTASTATSNAILLSLGGEWLPKDDITDANGKILVGKKHSTFQEIRENELLDSATFDRAIKAVTIRNPFDSIYSLWFKKKNQYARLLDDPNAFIHRVPNFKDDMNFIANHSFSDWFLWSFGKLADEGRELRVNLKWCHHATFIMRFESIAEDFDRLLAVMGLADNMKFAIPMLNETEGREPDYRPFYNYEARALGEMIFGRELKYFNYSFD